MPSPHAPVPRSFCSWLPRLCDREGAPRERAAFALVLLLGALGAGLVHIFFYHLGLGNTDPGTTAILMLQQCPLRAPLLVVLLVVFITVAAALREWHLLRRQWQGLAVAATPVELARAATVLQVPRSAARLFQLLPVMLAAQVVLYVLLTQFCPMKDLMVMDGVPMQMPITASIPLLPLLPLHLLIALLLAALVWRFEHRLTTLSAALTLVRRLLQCRAPQCIVFPLSPPSRLSGGFAGLAAFSRPPPLRKFVV